MSQQTGGEERRAGLFSALKNMIATVIAIGKTRAELLVTELEEEKLRLMSLWSKAIGAAFLLAVGSTVAAVFIAGCTGGIHTEPQPASVVPSTAMPAAASGR